MTSEAQAILREVLGIAPGDPLEVWHGVPIDDAIRAIEKALASRPTLSPQGIAEVKEALRFYSSEWEQDVDAEQTAHGWVGSVGDVQPTTELVRDAGSKARRLLTLIEGGGK